MWTAHISKCKQSSVLLLLVSYQLKLIKMRARLANLNNCAVHFLSRAATNLCWYYITISIICPYPALCRTRVTWCYYPVWCIPCFIPDSCEMMLLSCLVHTLLYTGLVWDDAIILSGAYPALYRTRVRWCYYPVWCIPCFIPDSSEMMLLSCLVHTLLYAGLVWDDAIILSGAYPALYRTRVRWCYYPVWCIPCFIPDSCEMMLLSCLVHTLLYTGLVWDDAIILSGAYPALYRTRVRWCYYPVWCIPCFIPDSSEMMLLSCLVHTLLYTGLVWDDAIILSGAYPALCRTRVRWCYYPVWCIPCFIPDSREMMLLSCLVPTLLYTGLVWDDAIILSGAYPALCRTRVRWCYYPVWCIPCFMPESCEMMLLSCLVIPCFIPDSCEMMLLSCLVHTLLYTGLVWDDASCLVHTLLCGRLVWDDAIIMSGAYPALYRTGVRWCYYPVWCIPCFIPDSCEMMLLSCLVHTLLYAGLVWDDAIILSGAYPVLYRTRMRWCYYPVWCIPCFIPDSCEMMLLSCLVHTLLYAGRVWDDAIILSGAYPALCRSRVRWCYYPVWLYHALYRTRVRWCSYPVWCIPCFVADSSEMMLLSCLVHTLLYTGLVLDDAIILSGAYPALCWTRVRWCYYHVWCIPCFIPDWC